MLHKIINTLFKVDSRALGIYRILLGWLCFCDIARRWNYIDVFYSDLGIKTQYVKTTSFTIFNYIGNSSLTVHLIFLIGLFFSLLLMIGYKSKLSHFITGIIIISIHVFVTKVGNSGDMFLNCMLIWTFFLPLGRSLSLDSLIASLNQYKESNLKELNNRNEIRPAKQFYSIAYLAVLFQISAIYFFTALDKHGYDWTHGKAFYKMHQLDGFITLFGYYIRDYITYPISKIFTLSALYLEYSVVFLLFIPFYSHILRLFAIIALSIFHIMIRLSMNIGLFTQTMITSFALLLDQKNLDYIKSYMKNKYQHNKFILFYDSDCGFCHYTIRIIKRLDVFHRINFDDGISNSEIKKPKDFEKLSDKTAILYNPEINQLWTRHKVFGKILSLLPFGFLISWIFFIPLISDFFGLVYDKIAQNRTKISMFFGLPACNLPGIEPDININGNHKQKLKLLGELKKHIITISKVLTPILLIIMLSTAIHSALVENPGVQSFLIRNDFIEKKIKNKGRKSVLNKDNYFNWEGKRILEKIARFPRMIQMWKMFSPNVLSKDNIIIIEAFLENGQSIDPFTGKPPVLNSTDYSILMTNNSQLWRKYFENFRRFDATNKNSGSFTNWIQNPKNDYFKKNLNGQKIKTIKIWKVSQNSPNMLINQDGSFNEIKYPNKEPKVECLSIKKTSKNRNKNNNKKPNFSKEQEPAMNLQEYFKRHKTKK